MARYNDARGATAAVNALYKTQRPGAIDTFAPDAVPLGYLTLHEAFERFHRLLHGKTSMEAGDRLEGSDEAKFFSTLLKHGRQILGAQHILATAFQHGYLTAVARDPKTLDWLRIPPGYWSQNFFPPRQFISRPLSAPHRSPLGRYRGRTLLVGEQRFAKWLKTKERSRRHLDQDMRPAPNEPRRQGRPLKYDWQQFTDEVLRLLDLRDYPREGSGLPAWRNQADLERSMSTWCFDNWGKEPSRSTIQNWVNKAVDQFRAKTPTDK